MADISDSEGLEAWLMGKSPELACVLAARAALGLGVQFGRRRRRTAPALRLQGAFPLLAHRE